MAIRILVTGGTFDKEYDELTGKLFFQETHLIEMLRLGRCTAETKVSTLMMVDSLEMNDADRETIHQQCIKCTEDKIIITHGTDTMEITAKLLGKANIPKTIVLTGAMIPYKFGSSDGLFNLGSAISLAQSLQHGVYVAMNGKCFSWERVRKNRETGTFEEKV